MVDQVSQALGGLAQTIQVGLGNIAQQRVSGAMFELKTAQVAQQSQKDALTIRSMQRREFEQKQIKQHNDAPFHISSLIGRADEIALPDIITGYIPRVERVFQAKLDPESGNFIKPNGDIITNRDGKLKSGPLLAEMLASVSFTSEFAKHDLRLAGAIEQATASGDTGKAQELEQQRIDNQKRAKAHATNPTTLWQKQLNALSDAQTRFQDIADIAGVTSKIKTLQSQVTQERSKQTQLAVAGVRTQRATDTRTSTQKEFDRAVANKTFSGSFLDFVKAKTAAGAAVKPDVPLSPLGKLMADRDRTGVGDTDREAINAKIEAEMNKGSRLTGIAKEIFDLTGEKPRDVKQIQKFKQDTALLTKEERSTITRRDALPKIQAIPPEEAYERGWKMNDDGSVFTELDTGAPVRLPSFEKVMGKRGMTKAVLAAGEHADDAKEVQALMADPTVASALNEANNAGMWDIARGAWSNKIRGWLQRRGLATNSKVTEAVVRMGRLASRSRKEFLGTAVTATELRSVQSWLPSIGDSFSLMLQKVGVAADESDEIFTRFLDVFKNQANMSPFYRAFGINRFGQAEGAQESQEVLDIKAKFGLE